MDCTANGQYIIFLYPALRMVIIVLDIATQRTLKYTVPQKLYYGAVITGNDPCHNEILTFGFVKRAFKEPQFHELQMLPHYIIQMISKWFCNEKVTLVETNGDFERIDVDEILKAAVLVPAARVHAINNLRARELTGIETRVVCHGQQTL